MREPLLVYRHPEKIGSDFVPEIVDEIRAIEKEFGNTDSGLIGARGRWLRHVPGHTNRVRLELDRQDGLTGFALYKEPAPFGYTPRKAVDAGKLTADLQAIGDGLFYNASAAASLVRRHSAKTLEEVRQELLDGRTDITAAEEALDQIRAAIDDLTARPWTPPSGIGGTAVCWFAPTRRWAE